MSDIYLLRHGQCLGGDIFRGSTDVALTDRGQESMHLRLAVLPDTAWDLIVCSPLIRCQHFAQTLAKEQGIPLRIEPDLREMHFGDWEARLIAEVWENDALALSQWRDDPSCFTPSGGEVFAAFSHRVETALARLAGDYHGKRMLVVSHGGVLRLLLSRALGLPATAIRELHVPYAGLIHLRLAANGLWQLVEQHLDDI